MVTEFFFTWQGTEERNIKVAFLFIYVCITVSINQNSILQNTLKALEKQGEASGLAEEIL